MNWGSGKVCTMESIAWGEVRFILLTKKKSTSWELSFIWGKMRTASQETGRQITLRDCSKEAVGEGQSIRFRWGGSSVHSSPLVVIQSLSRVWLFVTPWTAAYQPSLSLTVSWSLLRLMSIELVMWSNHLISVTPFSSSLQSFPASGSCILSWPFTSCGQSVGASASTSVLTVNMNMHWNMNSMDWFSLGLTGLISLQYKGLPRVFSNTTVQRISSLVLSLLYGPTLRSIHDYWKNHRFD